MKFDNISTLTSQCLRGREYVIRSQHTFLSELDEDMFTVVYEDDVHWNGKGVLLVLLDNGEPITLDWLRQQKLQLDELERYRLLRQERDKLLKETDYLMNPDYPHPTEEIKQKWIDYRQQLRDLPNNSNPILSETGELDMNSVEWPLKPT